MDIKEMSMKKRGRKITAFEIQDLARKTRDAYSHNRYRVWHLVIERLADRGYDNREIEAIVRSKWTRWAADASPNPEGSRASSRDLINWIEETYPSRRMEQEAVNRLVESTFDEEAANDL